MVFLCSYMGLEDLREGVVKFESFRYKAKAIGGLVLGIIISIVGVVFAFVSSFLSGLIIFLVGVLVSVFSLFSFRSSRHTAEIKAGMHGIIAQRRLRKMGARH